MADFVPQPLPSPDVAASKGWKWQVDWYDEGNSCFQRFKSREEAVFFANTLSPDHKHHMVREISHD